VIEASTIIDHQGLLKELVEEIKRSGGVNAFARRTGLSQG
jgi:hypothetical protein